MIDFNSKGKVISLSWSNCIGAGRANEGLRADWQQQLKDVIDNCGFRYLRFHGLLHDDMHIYKIEKGQDIYNFQYVDMLFDKMLELGIRPFVEFGFMPKCLASNGQTQFWWKGNVAPPNDYNKWARMIEKCVRHWIYRYGIDEVRKWYFEIWNEPNLNPFWSGTKSEYFKLYEVSVNAIKMVNAGLRVGGPATSNYVPDGRFDGEVEDTNLQKTFQVDDIDELNWHGVWIEDFLEFCEDRKLPVDFISCHPYPTDFALDGHGECSGKTRKKESLKDDVDWLKEVVQKSIYKDAEIHLTEWSSSPSSRDYSHDFLPEAAYIVQSVFSVDNSINSLSYWVFTDIFEELGAGPAPFHGGFGLITLQGVKKPAYHAYKMLNKLGDIEIDRGNDYILTKKNNKLAALFYNYPDDYKKTIPMSFYPDMDAAIECQKIKSEKRIAMEISGLQKGDVYILEVVNDKCVAANKWRSMGAPLELTVEQEMVLRKIGDSTEKREICVGNDGIIKLDITLEAWNIASLYIKE